MGWGIVSVQSVSFLDLLISTWYFLFLVFKPFEKRYASVFVYQEISVPMGLPLGESGLPYSLCPAGVVRGGVWRGVPRAAWAVPGSQPWLRGLFMAVVLLFLFPLLSSSVKQRSLRSLISWWP